MERIRQAIEIARARRGETSPRPGTARTAPRMAREREPLSGGMPKGARVDPRHLEEMRVFAFDARDPRTAYFDMLRTKVVPKMAEGGWTTLAVTSPGPGCGKTFAALNLALSIARLPGRKVLLVDLDLRKPQVANCLGIRAGHGLAQVLAGEVPMAEAVVVPELGVRGLAVLPAIAPLAGSAEAIVSEPMKDLVHQLKQALAGDLIIFDMPPMLLSDDLLAFLPQVDCVLLVAAVGQSSVAEIQECERLLSNANLLGIAVNKIRESVGKHYYQARSAFADGGLAAQLSQPAAKTVGGGNFR